MSTLDFKKIRKSLNLTQNELAAKLGVHYKTIQNWEKGGVIPESKKILLRHMGILPADENSEYHFQSGNAETVYDKNTVYFQAQLTCLLPLSARSTEISPAHLHKHGNTYEKIQSPVKGADFAIVLSDDGLGPEFPDGAVVYFKHIDPTLFIEWGKVHAVSTKNGLIIKRLNPGSTPGTLLFSCADPQFNPFEIDGAEADLHFYKAIACTAVK